MKNKKFFVAVLLLAATALLFSSCAFKMNTEQQTYYENFITSLKVSTTLMDMPAGGVKTFLTTTNVGAEKLGFKIEDKESDKPITKGTSEEALKKRFVAKKK